MNKKVLIVALFAICTIKVNAQFAMSDLVPLQKGMFADQWYPFVSIMTTDNRSFRLGVRNPDTNDYKSIPSNGKMLVKFANDSIITLYHTEEAQQRDYKVGNYVKSGVLYLTFDSYGIEDIDFFLENEITKIRIELSNYNYFDFDIKRSYQKELRESLIEAYNECKREYEERHNNKENFEEGF